MADLKLDLLIKVLGMTTSSADGEALSAVRRANSMLKSAAISWETLLRGKVTVVADPFANIPTPSAPQPTNNYKPPAPARPQTPQWSKSPSPPRPARATQFTVKCFFCLTLVPSGAGVMRYVPPCGPEPTGANKVFCIDCNIDASNGKIDINQPPWWQNRQAQKAAASAKSTMPRNKRKVTTADLMDGLK